LAGRNGVTLPVSPHIAAIATQHGVPVIELSWSDHDALLQAKVGNQTIPLSDFLGKTVFPHPPWPAYAFMATRIHDDFQLIRSAIRSAVESDLHIPCIYFEDRRIVTAPCGVRERTREMIRGASLFVADLTHSDSCPDHDSPNTAHEIGMAMAYGIPIVTCARQPRRNLYFLAGDLDAIFWKNEQDLFEQLRAWLNPRRELLGLRIPDQGDEPSRPMSAAFEFDPALQYTGPSMKNQAGN
jgi:hypothetical protein